MNTKRMSAESGYVVPEALGNRCFIGPDRAIMAVLYILPRTGNTVLEAFLMHGTEVIRIPACVKTASLVTAGGHSNDTPLLLDSGEALRRIVQLDQLHCTFPALFCSCKPTERTGTSRRTFLPPFLYASGEGD